MSREILLGDMGEVFDQITVDQLPGSSHFVEVPQALRRNQLDVREEPQGTAGCAAFPWEQKWGEFQ